ncbi:ZIP family metal transporter [bacterium]|nr:ZIP family metal transporter [bacterium]
MIFYYLFGKNPIYLAFLGGVFTWFITLLGASLIFLSRKPDKRLFDMSLAFSGGIMTGASFFSLLLPSIEYSKIVKISPAFSSTVGFLLGSLFLYLLNRFIPHLHPKLKEKNTERTKTTLPPAFLLVFAITLHNIPEGLAVGVSFGSLKYFSDYSSLISACMLAIGIGIQNFPEGIAVSFPLRNENLSKRKSFFWGQLSGIVEPVFAVIGAIFVGSLKKILPFSLSFAAGAMIFVVVEEVIPEIKENQDIATLFFLFGLAFMMFLDVYF